MDYTKGRELLIKDSRVVDGVVVFRLKNGLTLFVSKKTGDIVSFKNSK